VTETARCFPNNQVS